MILAKWLRGRRVASGETVMTAAQSPLTWHLIPMRVTRWSLIAQASFYILAGINHFWHTTFYLRVMPAHYTHPEPLVLISGAAEILGGVGLLLPATRRFSAACICVMLTVFLDVHLSMLVHATSFREVPLWLLWARIPLQFAFIAWAWAYTKAR